VEEILAREINNGESGGRNSDNIPKEFGDAGRDLSCCDDFIFCDLARLCAFLRAHPLGAEISQYDR
jgi:hypothetical protein